MSADPQVVSLESRASGRAAAPGNNAAPSEDSIALQLVEQHLHDYRFVASLNRWYAFDGKRWYEEKTGRIFAEIRKLVRRLVVDTNNERKTANAAFVAGVERLARCDQRIVVLPDQLDADPWLLNTQSGIVDLRTGALLPHDPAKLLTRITAGPLDPSQGRELWWQFLAGITLGDKNLEDYLQRLAGYCATGDTSEDVLFYPYGIGSNGKSSFAEALEAALGDYAMFFPSEVLMESRSQEHPTSLAQFRGIRLAVSSEPSSSAVWNDSRIKSLTGDAVISARIMRGDYFVYPRSHKTLVIGNHMPRLNAVTHAIRRRIQMIPFRAVFERTPGPGIRERLKSEALGAVLAWIVAGAAEWRAKGTMPPAAVRDLTEDYLSEQDEITQWLDECCDRVATGTETSGSLYRSYVAWCERNGMRAKSNKALSAALVERGFKKDRTMIGRVFTGLTLRGHDAS